MLALNFGDWTFWEAYAPSSGVYGGQKVTFDGPNRLILINYGETSIDFKEDVYSNWKEWMHEPNHVNSAYPEAISVIGGDPLPGARRLGTTYFLENGWRMRTWEGEHILTVSGNIFTREGDDPFVSTIGDWKVTINLNTSTLVETVETVADVVVTANVALSANSTADIANNVWQYVVDDARNQTAKNKLAKIATKAQDIALE